MAATGRQHAGRPSNRTDRPPSPTLRLTPSGNRSTVPESCLIELAPTGTCVLATELVNYTRFYGATCSRDRPSLVKWVSERRLGVTGAKGRLRQCSTWIASTSTSTRPDAGCSVANAASGLLRHPTRSIRSVMDGGSARISCCGSGG
jgi:hypothetical protein